MKKHTTHFDDCGCLSDRLKKERDKLRALLLEAVRALEEIANRQCRGCLEKEHSHPNNTCSVLIAKEALARIREEKKDGGA